MGWLVVRVRGGIHADRTVRTTLDQLHLTRPNHATVVPDSPSVQGMLRRVQGYVTWGEADPATVALLIEKRGEPASDPAPPADGTPIPELARLVAQDGLLRAPGYKPVWRLKAPAKGWRSTKKPFSLGGALGYRGSAINELVRRMV